MAVYPHFDPTSLIAGDFPLAHRKINLPAGLNAAGSPLEPGVLLGAQTNAGAFSAAGAAKAGNTGNGTLALGSPATLANVIAGVYRVVFSSATAFQVYDPKGDEIGVGANGAAFATQIKFTTTAGATAFVAGDEFDVTVAQAQANAFSVAAAAGGSNVGNGTLALASPAALAYAQAGVYKLAFVSATQFMVSDPFGDPVGEGVVGTAFANQIGFTVAAGATAFAQGDSFAVTVSALNLHVPSVRSATDGSQTPDCVLAEWVDTSAGPVTADAYFTGEFAFEKMTVDPSWTMETLSQAFAASGRSLFVRSVGAAA
jgi:hypothetical protein